MLLCKFNEIQDNLICSDSVTRNLVMSHVTSTGPVERLVPAGPTAFRQGSTVLELPSTDIVIAEVIE